MRRFSGTISLLLAMMLVFILGASTKANAQDKLRINVPFAFTANHQYLPAGIYNVYWLSDRYMELSNSKTGDAAVLMVRPEQGNAIETRGRFVFLQDGTRFYLARVWMAGSSVHSEMTVQHKMEPRPKLAKDQTPGTVEIAMDPAIR
jgi:hypothetical protein